MVKIGRRLYRVIISFYYRKAKALNGPNIMKIISSKNKTAYLEHVRLQKKDDIDCLAAIFNWKHKSGRDAHCLLRAYIKSDHSSVIVLSAMRFGADYQPFHCFLELVNLLYPILEESFAIFPEKIHWISHYGNFSEYQHELTPDEYYHEPLRFREGIFEKGDMSKYWGIPRGEINKHVPFELEPGAELIESLGWGKYPISWGAI